MRTLKSKGLLIAALSALIACILQVIGLIRYLGRLPEDWIGIGLYSTTIIAFLITAIGFFIQFRKQTPKD
ncbi:hypothetical protein ACFLWC_02650 [Chloroflexota bacterium]